MAPEKLFEMTAASERLGIEFISVLGLPPVAFVELAADLGCRNISLAVAPLTQNPHDYQDWSLRGNARLRRETVAALRDHGVSVSLGEGFLVQQDRKLGGSAADLDIMCELGAPRVNVLSLDPDLSRALDELGRFAELAASRGVETVLEFIPGQPIGDLASAMAAKRHVGRSDFRLVVDFMHVFRSGSNICDLGALSANDVGYIQLCDVPLIAHSNDYAHEAVHERLSPGEGELPILDALRALPRDVTVGLEVPKLTKAKAGVGPRERLSQCVADASALLAQLDGTRA
jgi:sugar phosphate isomerase/epimerase